MREFGKFKMRRNESIYRHKENVRLPSNRLDLDISVEAMSGVISTSGRGEKIVMITTG